jgi:Ca2+-binding RTX toxin-like protein
MKEVALMKRTILLMATMALTLLVVGGVAYALTVQCDGEGDQNLAEGICEGTLASDNITGTSGDDEIHAKAENDTVDALGGIDTVRGAGESDTLYGGDDGDTLIGDGLNVAERDGQDYIYGEDGKDTLDGEGGVNHYFGETGADTIDAAYNRDIDPADGLPDNNPADAGEIIHGGRGNDDISTKDGLFDDVFCGPGNRDMVSADPVDELHDCELFGTE